MGETTIRTETGHLQRRKKTFFQKISPVYYALLLLCVVGAITQPTFLSLRNFRNVIISGTPLAIVTIGQTMALLTAGIDLSIGPVISLTNTIAAFFMKPYPDRVFEIVIICLASGLLIGLANGLAIAYLRLNPFIITLATGTIIQGITLGIMYQPGGLVTAEFGKIAKISIGPIPYAIFYIIILYLIGAYILRRTPFGLSIYAVGGNETSARLSGIRTKRVLIFVYMISGFTAVLAGLFIASRIGSGDPIVGDPFSLDTITAAVLGGTSLFGGVGTFTGGLAGAFIITILSTILNLNNISPFYQWIAKGITLIAALAIDLWRKRSEK
jgi:ribose transport system permease protein